MLKHIWPAPLALLVLACGSEPTSEPEPEAEDVSTCVAGEVCRAPSGPCDVAEVCDKKSGLCPADELAPAATECRPAAGDCDVAETCTGDTAACPDQTFAPNTVQCRVADGACNLAEWCDGLSPVCPTDTDTVAPKAPLLEEAEASSSATSVSVQWSDVAFAGAAEYAIRWSTDATFAVGSTTSEWQPGTSFAVPLPTAETYYWRVSARDATLTTCGSKTSKTSEITRSGLAVAPRVDVNTSQQISTGGTPTALAVTDVNGDTHPDLLVGSNYALLVSRGSSNGAFTSFSAPSGAHESVATSVALGRLNGDAYPDLIAAVDDGYTLEVYLNTGDATAPFANKTTLSFFAGAVLDLVTFDVQGDGFIDLVASTSTHRVLVFEGNGSGGFAGPYSYATGTTPRALIAADIDDDGRTDLVTANQDSDSLAVLLNASETYVAFDPPTFLPTGREPRSVTTADFDGDGVLDLASAPYSSTLLSVFLGSGSGSFSAPIETPVFGGQRGIATGDFTQDGRSDLVLAGVGPLHPNFLAGRGDGTFLNTFVSQSPGSISRLSYVADQADFQLVDVNHDDQLDLISIGGTYGAGHAQVSLVYAVTP